MMGAHEGAEGGGATMGRRGYEEGEGDLRVANDGPRGLKLTKFQNEHIII